MDDRESTRPVASEAALTLEDARAIRSMLLKGLACYGELQRLENAAEIHQFAGEAIPADMKPIDPIGDPEAVSMFADALLRLEHLEAAQHA